MIPIKYNIVIEATDDPLFFTFYSPDLDGFTGVGNSIEDCIYKAINGIEEHIKEMKKLGLFVPPENKNAHIIIANKETEPIAV